MQKCYRITIIRNEYHNLVIYVLYRVLYAIEL